MFRLGHADVIAVPPDMAKTEPVLGCGAAVFEMTSRGRISSVPEAAGQLFAVFDADASETEWTTADKLRLSGPPTALFGAETGLFGDCRTASALFIQAGVEK